MSDYKSEVVKRIVKSLPFFIKNQNNLDRIIEPINVLKENEKQSIVNALVSQYDHTLPYNYLTNETDLESICPFVSNSDNNLVLNIRDNYDENVSRYIFGYKPKYISESQSKYYKFSEIVPTIRNMKRSDYIYVDSSFYDKYIIPEELYIIAKNSDEILLTLPIILKHWEHMNEYMCESEELKKILLSQLKKLNCLKYYSMVERLVPNNYSRPNLEVEGLNKRESFLCLISYLLEENYKIIKKELNNDEIGFLLYNIVNGSDLSELNVKLPPTKTIDMLDISNKTVKQAPFKDTSDYYLTPIPAPPPLPAMNTYPEKVYLLDKNDDPNSDKVLNKVKEFVDEQNVNRIPKNQKPKWGLIEELTSYFKGKFNGGDSFTYNEDVDDVKTLDTGSFPDTELDVLKVIIPRLSKSLNIKISSAEELRYRLFFNAKFGNYFSDSNFKRRLKELTDIIKNNKTEFLEYKFKEYDVESFVILDKTGLDALKAYRLYFEMLRGLLFYMNQTSSGSISSIPRENLMYIGISLIVLLNNFGYYVFGDLLAFRNYIDGFYTLLKRINADEVPIVSLYSSIHSVIHDFLDKTKIFIGGGEGIKVYDYFPYFNFFKHVYVFDIISSSKKESIKNPSYNSETLNSKPIDIFWDGISFEDLYKHFNIEKKYIYTVIYETFFINNKLDGSVFETKYSSDFHFSSNNPKHNPRVVFLANEIVENISTYTLLKNLSDRTVNDINKEVDVEYLTREIEKIFGNNAIRHTDRMKIIDNPSCVPAFLKAINNNTSKVNLDSATLLETMLFFFVTLEKLGFNVQKTFAKTNMTIVIQPALLKSNIEKELGKYPNAVSELNKEFLNNYGDKLEALLNNSSAEIYAGSCNNDENYTKLIIKLPKPDELTIDSSVLEENTEQVILDRDGILKKEIDDFDRGIDLMLNSNTVNEDTMFRMVPYYIKEQIRFVSQDLSENSQDSSEDEIGGNKEQVNIVDLFLQKVRTLPFKQTNNNVLSEEEVSKTIDRYLKENYIQSMNKIIPFYDNQISVGNGRDKSFLLLKYTLDTINYMRTHMKLDLDQSIKTGIFDIIRLKQESDEYCYKIFILIKYIRHVTDDLYNRLRIQPENVVLNFTEFHSFFEMINKSLNDRNDQYKRIINEKTLSYIKNKLGTNYLRDINKDLHLSFLKLFNPNFSNKQTVIDIESVPRVRFETPSKFNV